MNNILTLEQMINMSTDDIINAYRNGYTLEDDNNNVNNSNQKIVSAEGISVGADAILLIGLGVLAYLYIKKKL